MSFPDLTKILEHARNTHQIVKYENGKFVFYEPTQVLLHNNSNLYYLPDVNLLGTLADIKLVTSLPDDIINSKIVNGIKMQEAINLLNAKFNKPVNANVKNLTAAFLNTLAKNEAEEKINDLLMENFRLLKLRNSYPFTYMTYENFIQYVDYTTLLKMNPNLFNVKLNQMFIGNYTKVKLILNMRNVPEFNDDLRSHDIERANVMFNIWNSLKHVPINKTTDDEKYYLELFSENDKISDNDLKVLALSRLQKAIYNVHKGIITYDYNKYSTIGDMLLHLLFIKGSKFDFNYEMFVGIEDFKIDGDTLILKCGFDHGS